MLLRTLTVFALTSLCVDGIAPDEPRYAVSSQSYHRDDVPLSYKYTSVHIHQTPRPGQRLLYQHTSKQETPTYPNIQYAPIKKHNYNLEKLKQKFQHFPHQIEQYERSLGEDVKSHLEPKHEEENLQTHDQNYRSYVPGHNIELHQSSRVPWQNVPLRTNHNTKENQNIDVPKFVINQKLENTAHVVSRILTSEEPASEKHDILYRFLPKPLLNKQHTAYEKPLNQALSAKAPRLHLNIARVYGLANVHPQALYNNSSKKYFEKPLSHTQAIFLPVKASYQQKTILYPVQDTNKNYPIHT